MMLKNENTEFVKKYGGIIFVASNTYRGNLRLMLEDMKKAMNQTNRNEKMNEPFIRDNALILDLIDMDIEIKPNFNYYEMENIKHDNKI